MNVTLKLKDDLGKRAQHRALDEGQSLSAWVASLIQREFVRVENEKPKTLLDALGDVRFDSVETSGFEFERDQGDDRAVKL